MDRDEDLKKRIKKDQKEIRSSIKLQQLYIDTDIIAMVQYR